MSRSWAVEPFAVTGRVNRARYLATGLVLAALKYAIEYAIVKGATGQDLTLPAFMNPLLDERVGSMQRDLGALVALFCVTLPFVWIAVVMSMRRAVDAGVSPTFAVAVLVPFVNLALFALLSIWPSRPAIASPEVASRPAKRGARGSRSNLDVGCRLLALAASFVVFLLGMTFSVYAFRQYGATVFFVMPILMGIVAGLIDRALNGVRGVGAILALQVMGVTGALLMLFALEGALCIAVLLPIAYPLVWFGVFVGYAIDSVESPRKTTLTSLALVPVLVAFDLRREPPEYEVMTAREVDAPPERVWPHVVGFSELPPANDLYFRLGVAHPVRARLDGEGVGAVRYCEFSTGPFVEPITAWEPPLRLAFDVVSQPHPMHELSPWGRIAPPHLERTLTSRRGEFRLVPLPGGRTRLEGRTWYSLDLWPQAYFKLWSDDLIHRIHARVLDHVASLAER